MQAGVRRRVHRVPRHGRVLAPLVRRGAPGTDGLPHQEAARRRGNPLWQRKDLPPREMRGQNQEEVLLGKLSQGDPSEGLVRFETCLVFLACNWGGVGEGCRKNAAEVQECVFFLKESLCSWKTGGSDFPIQ